MLLLAFIYSLTLWDIIDLKPAGVVVDLLTAPWQYSETPEIGFGRLALACHAFRESGNPDVLNHPVSDSCSWT